MENDNLICNVNNPAIKDMKNRLHVMIRIHGFHVNTKNEVKTGGGGAIFRFYKMAKTKRHIFCRNMYFLTFCFVLWIEFARLNRMH